jgi:pimeloyl-ACP methyl ester carboxylesterase
MVHGAAASSRSFAEQIPHLAKHFRVLAVDLRGMGRSARVESLEPSAWVDDLGALLDHLGIEAAHVFGSSLGARVALRFAINNPRRVLSLVLDNPIVLNEGAGNAALNARMGDTASLSQEAKDRYRSLHGDDWEAVVQTYFRIRNEPGLQEYLNLRELAKGLETPTLLCRGDNRQDTVHPFMHAIELFNVMPNSRLWIKPAGGCFATPEGYDVVRDFCASASKEPATA